MSEEDKELEQLKEKRLAEMQKNISFQKKQEELVDAHKDEQKNAPKPRDILVSKLGYRGIEVLENAEAQFPNETKIVIEKLAELLTSGEIDEEIDGGKLMILFRSIGMNVRVQTTINVEQEGKFVSLSDKLTSKLNPDSKNQEVSE